MPQKRYFLSQLMHTIHNSTVSKIWAALACGLVCCAPQVWAGPEGKIVTRLGQEVLESMVESGVKSTIKQGGIKVTKKMTQKELINLIGHEPVMRMSRLMNMRNLREATDIVAHNPSKENIWRALADCSELEKSG